MGSSFTDDEKRFLLAELIKVSKADIHALVEFIKGSRLEPRWYSIQLPQGRNLEQCLQAAENMFQAPIPAPSLRREHASTPTLSAASLPALTPQGTDYHGHENMAVSTNLHALQTHRNPLSQHVPIQPRPVTVNGLPNPATSPAPEQQPPAKRRRGRPPRPKNISYAHPGMGPKALPTLAPLPQGSPSVQVPPVVQGTDGPQAGSPTVAYASPVPQAREVPGTARPRKRGRPPSDEGTQTPQSTKTEGPADDARFGTPGSCIEVVEGAPRASEPPKDSDDVGALIPRTQSSMSSTHIAPRQSPNSMETNRLPPLTI